MGLVVTVECLLKVLDRRGRILRFFVKARLRIRKIVLMARWLGRRVHIHYIHSFLLRYFASINIKPALERVNRYIALADLLTACIRWVTMVKDLLSILHLNLVFQHGCQVRLTLLPVQWGIAQLRQAILTFLVQFLCC